MVCSICGKYGHNKNNSKIHSKKDLEIHHNSILSKKLVNNIFKNIMFDGCKMEVQKHGFIIERSILTNCFEIPDSELNSINYTAKHDLPVNLNKLGFNISCKSSVSLNSVCMGDPINVYDSVNNKYDPIHMICVFYEQHGETKKIIKTVEVNLTDTKELLFGSLTKDDLIKLKNIIKKVPIKSKPTYEEYKNMYDLRNELHGKCGILRLDIKCNSQNSRLQCSFNKFKDFIQNHPDKIIENNDSNVLRGKHFISELNSGVRIFNKST